MNLRRTSVRDLILTDKAKRQLIYPLRINVSPAESIIDKTSIFLIMDLLFLQLSVPSRNARQSSPVQPRGRRMAWRHRSIYQSTTMAEEAKDR